MRKRCENERERESDRVRDGLWLPDLRLAPDLAAFRETVQLFLRREMAGGHTDGHRDHDRPDRLGRGVRADGARAGPATRGCSA